MKQGSTLQLGKTRFLKRQTAQVVIKQKLYVRNKEGTDRSTELRL